MLIRTKLTLTLLLIGLLTAATVGGVAYWMLMRDFNQLVVDGAFANFSTDVQAYLETHGSWSEAEQKEPFHDFVMRTRHNGPGGIPVDAEAMPPPPMPSGIDRRMRPPIHFLVMDPRGNVLKAVEPYHKGEMTPDSVRQQARAVVVDGRVEVLLAPIGEPNLSVQDLAYLSAMRQSLLAGILMAVMLAVMMGLFLGRRMSFALVRLTQAITSMRQHREMRQEVDVTSRDEIGLLAEAFNQMGTELTLAHAELRQSAETVEKQAQQLRELSIRDPLTELYNRRYFDEQAELMYQQAIRHQRPMTIMVGDLDRFKAINDRFSHAIGDVVLRRVGKILLEATRKSDVVARYGGEEFVIAFAESDAEHAAQRCEALRELIEVHPWQDAQPGLEVTISIGLSDSVSLGSVTKMMGEADQRLYQAKQDGRNRIVPAPADS